MAAFSPPPLSSHEGPAAGFTPPPVSSHEGVAQHSLLDDVGDTLKQWWNHVNPVTASQGIVTAAAHPIQAANSYGSQNTALYNQAVDAFKKGNYAEGTRHALSYFLNGIPGVGAMLDEAGNKAQSGDYKGAIADTAALATQLIGARVAPRAIAAATEPGAAAAAIDAVKDAASTGARVTKAAVKAAAPDVAVGSAKAATGLGVAQVIPGGPAKYLLATQPVMSGLKQVGRGLKAGYEAGAAAAESPEAAAASASAAKAAAEEAALLDNIALGMAGKTFDKITPAEQLTVRTIADRMKGVQPEVPQMSPPGPVNTGEPAPPQSQSLSDLIDQELAARRKAAESAAPPPEAEPATEAAPAPAPQPEAQPAASAPRRMTRAEMQAQLKGMVDPENKLNPPAEETPKSNAYEDAARATKAQKLAQWLYRDGNGIPSNDAKLMNPDHWRLAAKGAGVTEPSALTIKQALTELQKLEAAPVN